MATLDESMGKLDPDVRECIQSVIDRAGTSDADWQVLLAAGELLAEWKRHFGARVRAAIGNFRICSD